MDDFSEATENSLNCKLEKERVPVSKSAEGRYPKIELKVFSSIYTNSAIKTKKLYLLCKRILNLKVRLISILISFRQCIWMNEVQEAALTFKKIHHKQNQKKLKENIKLPQPFEDFADNHVVLRKNIF